VSDLDGGEPLAPGGAGAPLFAIACRFFRRSRCFGAGRSVGALCPRVSPHEGTNARLEVPRAREYHNLPRDPRAREALRFFIFRRLFVITLSYFPLGRGSRGFFPVFGSSGAAGAARGELLDLVIVVFFFFLFFFILCFVLFVFSSVFLVFFLLVCFFLCLGLFFVVGWVFLFLFCLDL
jgi:hypothetical protein